MPKVPTKPTEQQATKVVPQKKKTKAKPSAKSSGSTPSGKPVGESPSKRGPAKRKAPKPAARPVKYDEVSADLYTADGNGPITVKDAKEFLGWCEPPEGVKEGVHVIDGERVYMTNNVTNRPLTLGNVETLKQEILRRNWKLNLEAMIIGRTGLVLNGQHTLIALILAGKEWDAHPGKWKEYWNTEPTIEKLVAFGCSEDDATVNTMDTCKPRTLMEVICRSAVFADLKLAERKLASRMADYAIRLLWHRTGASLNAFAPRRTHAESLAFIENHPTLCNCVRHIMEENIDNSIGRYLPPGYAAAIMYLQAAKATDGDDYSASKVPSEKQVDLSLYETAETFWVELSGGDRKLKPVHDAIASYANDEEASPAVRIATIVKAWNEYSVGRSITAKRLELEFSTTEDGDRVLSETPTVGGIDRGDPEDTVEPEGKPQRRKTIATSRAGADWATGDVAWVFDAEGDHFVGTLAEEPFTDDGGRRWVNVTDEDTGVVCEVPYDDLRLERPK